jgi:signal peptidase I
LIELKESLQYNVVTYNIFKVAHPQKYWIKRVIGLPGDTIEIREDGVYRNGVLLEEDYVYDGEDLEYTPMPPCTVGKNEIFVMGDNRNHSMDSRDIGVVSQNAILGKVVKR